MKILLVEDNEADAYLTKEALRTGLPDSEITVVQDGEKALAFLRQENGFADVPRPDLVVMDLNIPRLDGFDVLTRLQDSPQLHDIPVVILSSSPTEIDIEHAYRLGASCYLTKSMELGAYLGLGHVIAELCQRLSGNRQTNY